MREILFRGKRKDNGEWVYGDLYHNSDGTMGIQEYLPPYIEFTVISETVGQYTGLKVNGEKIFEGDVIKFLDGSCFIVKQKYNLCSAKYRNLNNYPSLFNDKIDGIGIGNIHDNPELLEVKNER